MDWEIYEKYRSTLLLAVLLLVSSALLAFKQSSGVRSLQAFLVRFAMPPQRYLMQTPVPAPLPAAAVSEGGQPLPDTPVEPVTDSLAELRRKVQVISEDNAKLRDVLRLKAEHWPKAIAVRVVGRDPQRWFQEIVLDKGTEHGLNVGDPVIAVDNGREALIGRITETAAHVSKVMLLQDPLSGVAAEVTGATGGDGLVEGGNAHELYLKYLDRSSQVKIGDAVVTSGLGQVFPPGVAIGTVEDIRPDPRQLFLQAILRPAIKSSALRTVLVIPRKQDAP